MAPSHPTPSLVARELIFVEELPGALGRERLLPEITALQGIVARAGSAASLGGRPREGVGVVRHSPRNACFLFSNAQRKGPTEVRMCAGRAI